MKEAYRRIEILQLMKALIDKSGARFHTRFQVSQCLLGQEYLTAVRCGQYSCRAVDRRWAAVPKAVVVHESTKIAFAASPE